MKKFFITASAFAAIQFNGNFAAIDSAVDTAYPGSGKAANLTEIQNENGVVLTFTDANGNPQTASVGDYLQVELQPDGKTFKGFLLAPAAVVGGWTEATQLEGAAS
jgi:hypothetical protein